MNENEIPKYRKKKESSKSKSNIKSPHKHTYVECLIEYEMKSDNKLQHSHAKYCTICGKLSDIEIWNPIKLPSGFYRIMSDEEILEKYRGLEIKKVNDTFDKYVSIEK